MILLRMRMGFPCPAQEELGDASFLPVLKDDVGVWGATE
jgi:hypothetical protein